MCPLLFHVSSCTFIHISLKKKNMSSSDSSSSTDSEDSEDSEDTYVSVNSETSSSLRNKSNGKKMGKAQQFIHKANEAAKKIQKMMKLRLARKRLRQMCSSVWEQVLDPESGDYFYRKTTTKEIRWEKPTWFVPPVCCLSFSLPLLS